MHNLNTNASLSFGFHFLSGLYFLFEEDKLAFWILTIDSGLQELYSSLPADLFLKERWFADRGIQHEISLVDSVQLLRSEPTKSTLALNLFQTQPSAEYFYFLPFLIRENPLNNREVLFERNGYYFYDAVSTYEYVLLLEELIQNQTSFNSSRGTYQFRSYCNLMEPRLRLHGSTSNSLLFVTRSYLLKNYRRIYPGVNPELKTSYALTKLGSKQIPKIYGFFSYQSQSEYTLGTIMEAVDNTGTGWERWGKFLMSLSPENEKLLCEEAKLLGYSLGILHRDLSVIAGKDGEYRSFKIDDLEIRIENIINNLSNGLSGLPELDSIKIKLTEVKKKLYQKDLGAKFRIHGDLHLEQVIKAVDGWRIIDFEGEPLKSIPERENYDSPLKDLASMLRSISYRLNQEGINQREIEVKIGSSLVEGYLRSCRELKADFLPEQDEFFSLLTLFQIERAVYECLYESKYRPDWLWIPHTGLKKLLRSL